MLFEDDDEDNLYAPPVPDAQNVPTLRTAAELLFGEQDDDDAVAVQLDAGDFGEGIFGNMDFDMLPDLPDDNQQMYFNNAKSGDDSFDPFEVFYTRNELMAPPEKEDNEQVEDDDQVMVPSEADNVSLDFNNNDVQDCDSFEPRPRDDRVVTFPIAVNWNRAITQEVENWIVDTFDDRDYQARARCMLNRWIYLFPKSDGIKGPNKDRRGEGGIFLWDPLLEYTASLCKSGDNVPAMVQLLYENIKDETQREFVVLCGGTALHRILYGAGGNIDEAFQVSEKFKNKQLHVDPTLYRLHSSKSVNRYLKSLQSEPKKQKKGQVCTLPRLFEQPEQDFLCSFVGNWKFTDDDFYIKLESLIEASYDANDAYTARVEEWGPYEDDCGKPNVKVLRPKPMTIEEFITVYINEDTDGENFAKFIDREDMDIRKVLIYQILGKAPTAVIPGEEELTNLMLILAHNDRSKKLTTDQIVTEVDKYYGAVADDDEYYDNIVAIWNRLRPRVSKKVKKSKQTVPQKKKQAETPPQKKQKQAQEDAWFPPPVPRQTSSEDLGNFFEGLGLPRDFYK